MKENEKKIKGFRIPSSSIELANKLIKESGKEDAEWFEDILNQISTKQLILDRDGIPTSLRTHFGSDIAALKDATNSITTLFVNQMNRIAVEKNNWNQLIQEKENTFKNMETGLKEQISSLEQEIQNRDELIGNLNNTIIQQQNKIDGFDKLEEHLRKDIERLEGEKANLSGELQAAKDTLEIEKNKHEEEIKELKEQHKDEKSSLNERIVELVKQLQGMELIKEEHTSLKERVKEMERTLKQNSADYELKLTRTQEQSENEKEKALLLKERELREEFYIQSREDMKELYDKIERLQSEKSQLELENNQLKAQLDRKNR